MDKGKESKIYKTFIISLTITFVLSLSGIFIVVSVTNRNLIYEQAKAEARAHFSGIVMTRKWNAAYGGVYVEKKPGMQSNPYLQHPDIKTVDGKTYTMKNPALMTREISELSEEEGMYSFHITSLEPLNPGNKPDEFEKMALTHFEKGEHEAFQNEKRGDKTYFRYMAPLYVEESCLPCHSEQGYKTGDIRGGISVAMDISDIESFQRENTLLIIILAFLSISLILGLVGFFTLRLLQNISEARQQIETMAIMDELTGLFNRRHIMTRFVEEFTRTQRLSKDLGCIMIDIDNFKQINDRHGHLVGDELLREVARVIKQSVRTYDIVGRYGGEEFLVILPDTDRDDAKSLAERIRKNVRGEPERAPGISLQYEVTVSLGVACMREQDASIDDIIKRADDNLYEAKKNGRDRVIYY